MISHYISRYIVMSYPVSRDITRYDTSRYVSISRIFGTDIEISYPVHIFLDTERIPNTIFYPPRCSKFGAPES